MVFLRAISNMLEVSIFSRLQKAMLITAICDRIDLQPGHFATLRRREVAQWRIQHRAESPYVLPPPFAGPVISADKIISHMYLS